MCIRAMTMFAEVISITQQYYLFLKFAQRSVVERFGQWPLLYIFLLLELLVAILEVFTNI